MWIESHQSLRNHRKTGRLARRLGVNRVAAIGHLHCFWWWCMDNAPNGTLAGIDAEDIAEGAEWEGDPAEFVAALDYAGFTEDGTIHDWYDYAGKLIERRQKDAARKRESRHPTDDPPTKPLRNGDIQRTSDGHPADGVRTVPNRTVPNPTEPYPTTPKEGADAPAPKKVRAVKRPVETFVPNDEEIAAWQRQYPELDVGDQLTRLRNYCRSHGKEYADYAATFDNWLKRAADERPQRASANGITHLTPNNQRSVTAIMNFDPTRRHR